MSTKIHPTAVVDPAARIADTAVVGPLCVVGPDVQLDDGVELMSHVVVAGHTHIGADTRVFPFASLGQEPQIYGDADKRGRLEIGRDTVIREHVTVNIGSPRQEGLSRIGNACLLMIGAHVAHDCVLGDRVIMANNVALGGHVTVGEQVFIGGLSAVHQRVRIGDHAFIGGMTGVEQDVIPYGMVVGDRGHLEGLNIVGLKRRGFDNETIHRLRNAFRSLFFGQGEWATRIDELNRDFGEDPAVALLLDFLRGNTDRNILKPRYRLSDAA